MNLRYRVELSQTERAELTALLSGGKHAARKLKRAQVLLAADAGAGDEEISRSVGVGGSTVYRTKRRFVLGDLPAALSEQPRPGAKRSSPARRRPCWLPPPVPTHQQGGRVGRWSFWRRARIEQVVGKLKRFKRIALRCEKTAQNYGSFFTEAGMNLRYRVELSQTERAELTALLSGGKHAARKLKRAQVLLAADAGAGDEEISRSVGVGGSTVYRTKRRFVLGDLPAALSEQPRPGAKRSSPARRRPCWLPPPVPTHQQGGRVGRWSFWRRARIEQVVGKLKRFKRIALRCEKTAQNYGSFFTEAGMNLRYRVELSQTERAELTALLSGGKHAARKLKRAQVLLAADAGAGDEEISRSVGVGGSTVYRTKRRFVLGDLPAALSEQPRPGAKRSSPARRRPCWSPPPVPTHQQGGRVGRWSFWRRARIEQVVGKLKRFKRIALRCEKVAYPVDSG